MSGPVLAVRVAANVEELRRNLQEGVVNQVEVVRSSLQRMATAYDPQVLIQRANTTAAAIQQVGGVTVLSAEQMRRANQAVDEGVAAYTRLGKEAPTGLLALQQTLQAVRAKTDEFGGSIVVTEAAMNQHLGTTGGLRTAYREFDNVLQAAGISVGAQAKGLLDIAEVAGKTTAQLGALATAGLVAGAAFAGWQVGRWIADIFDLDNKLSHLASTLLGYGDVAAQTAGAKQDVINRAIALGASETISYTRAVQFLAEHQQHLNDVYVISGQRLADAWTQIRKLSEATQDAIVRGKEHGATEEALSREFHISVDAVKEIIRFKGVAADASDKLRAKHDAEAESARRLTEQYEKQKSQFEAEIANRIRLDQLRNDGIAKYEAERAKLQPMIDLMGEYARKQREAADWLKTYTDAQDAAAQANDRLIESQRRVPPPIADTTKAVADQSKSFGGLQQQITFTGDAIKEWLRLQVAAASVNAILNENSLFSTQSQKDRIAAILRSIFGAGGGGVPSFASGVENFRGGVARVHRDEALVYMPRGTSVIPASRADSVGGGGMVVAPVLNFHGTTIGSSYEFKASVREAIVDAFRSLGQPLPAVVG